MRHFLWTSVYKVNFRYALYTVVYFVFAFVISLTNHSSLFYHRLKNYSILHYMMQCMGLYSVQVYKCSSKIVRLEKRGTKWTLIDLNSLINLRITLLVSSWFVIYKFPKQFCVFRVSHSLYLNRSRTIKRPQTIIGRLYCLMGTVGLQQAQTN